MKTMEYKKPSVEFIRFMNEDIITTSSLLDRILNYDWSGCNHQVGHNNGAVRSTKQGQGGGNLEHWEQRGEWWYGW